MPEPTQAKSLEQESLRAETRVWFLSPESYARIKSVHFVIYGGFKRTLDLLLATFSVVFLSPTFLILSVAIKLDSTRLIRTAYARICHDV